MSEELHSHQEEGKDSYLDTYACDAGFMGVMASEAVKGYQALGRGMLFVYLKQSLPGTFKLGYFPLDLMELAAFSAEMLGFARAYDPVSEAVIVLVGGGELKVYKFGVERIGRSVS